MKKTSGIVLGSLLLAVGFYGLMSSDSKVEGLQETASNEIQSHRKVANIKNESSELQNHSTQNTSTPSTTNQTAANESANRSRRSPTQPSQSPLEKFQNQSITKWKVKKDPFSKKIKRLRAGKIKLSGTNIGEKANDFIDRYANLLFEVPPRQLQLREPTSSLREKIAFQQNVNGIPIYTSQLILIFNENELVHIESSLVSDAHYTGRVDDEYFKEAIAQYVNNPSSDYKSGNASTISAVERVQPHFLKYLYSSANGLVPAVMTEAVISSGGASESSQLLIQAETGRLIKRLPSHVH